MRTYLRQLVRRQVCHHTGALDSIIEEVKRVGRVATSFKSIELIFTDFSDH